jgi:hypothetical protein
MPSLPPKRTRHCTDGPLWSIFPLCFDARKTITFSREQLATSDEFKRAFLRTHAEPTALKLSAKRVRTCTRFRLIS